jgi:hypothetical protein
MNHLLELTSGDLSFLFVGFLFDEYDLFGDVTGAEEEKAISWQAIASGPPGFLIIALEVLG